MTKLGDGAVEGFVEGAWGRVVFLRHSDGSVPGKEYFEGLPPKGRAQLRVAAEHLAAVGAVANPERFHKIHHKGQPVVFEIKVHDGPGHRFYCIQQGRLWVISHATKKPRNNGLYGPEVARCHKALKEQQSD